MQRGPEMEKPRAILADGLGALVTPLWNGIDMNTKSKSENNQPVPLARRGFLSKAGAAAMAVVAAAAVLPAQVAAAEVAAPQAKEASSITGQGLDNAVLERLCLANSLMFQWYLAHEDVIQQLCPDLDPDLFDLAHEARASAEAAAKASGIAIDAAYVSKRTTIYQGRAEKIAKKLNGATALRHRALIKNYDLLGDDVQLTVSDIVKDFANQPLLCRAPRLKVAGGRAA